MNTSDPKVLIVATFVALSAGFGAGYWIGSQSDDPTPPTTASGEMPPHPVGAQEYVQLGMTALSSGQFGEAERRFRQALERAPNNPDVHTDLAVALMYQERWDDAWEQIQAAKDVAPEMPEVFFLEGIVYRDARGDTTEARESWNRFLELVPPDTPQAQTVREWLADLDGEATPGSDETGEGDDAGSPAETPAGE